MHKENTDIRDKINANKEFLKVVDLFENSTMPVKIPNWITMEDYFKFKKISKFEEKHGHIEDYVKKPVKHVYDEEEVMIAVEHAVESNADDVEIVNKITNESDTAVKKPEVEKVRPDEKLIKKHEVS